MFVIKLLCNTMQSVIHIASHCSGLGISVALTGLKLYQGLKEVLKNLFEDIVAVVSCTAVKYLHQTERA